jgi:hypothetical protein
MEKIYTFASSSENTKEIPDYEISAEAQNIWSQISNLKSNYYDILEPEIIKHISNVIHLGFNQYLNKKITHIHIETESEYDDEGGYYDLINLISFYDAAGEYIDAHDIESIVKEEYKDYADDIYESFENFREYINDNFPFDDLSYLGLFNKNISLNQSIQE